MGKIDFSQIRKALTEDGEIPEGYAFLCDGLIHIWDPQNDFSVLMIEANHLAQACRDYLLANNKRFDSLQQAKETIIAQKWLGWEKLLDVCDP